MNSRLPDDFLQPVIDALTSTGLGCPKTQAVFDKFLDRLEKMLERGYTYKQIAEVLKAGNARGRRGAEFTAGSLHNIITRAQMRRAREDLARPGTSNAAGEPTGYDLEPPVTSTGRPVSTNVSSSPALDEFKRLINEAKSHAAVDEILFRRRTRG
jgi:hypothetical protein